MQKVNKHEIFILYGFDINVVADLKKNKLLVFPSPLIFNIKAFHFET